MLIAMRKEATMVSNGLKALSLFVPSQEATLPCLSATDKATSVKSGLK
jgi:hypothetical protein